jgi:phosphatidylserine/phosphatidylglycerophosphate/cardiolipin synthase-like enzyme
MSSMKLRAHLCQYSAGKVLSMKKKRRMKFRYRLLAALVILLLGGGGCIFSHFQRGGTLEELTADVREKTDQALGYAKKWKRDLAAVAGEDSGKTENGEAQETEEGGDISVYFTPVSPLNPFGADDRLIGLIEDAEFTIDAAFYELALLSVADALIARHIAGVRVRLVSDSHYENREGMQRCTRAGIPVIFDNRSAYMHNKFCIIDSKLVWTGSTNITENGFFKNNNNIVLITSEPLAENYTMEFLEMFEKEAFGGRSPRNTPHPVLTIGPVRIECYFAPEDDVEKAIIRTLDNADKTIDFMAFSFTSEPIAEKMGARMKQGARVRGLFEARSAGGRYARDDWLREKGAEIHMDSNTYTMHHKVIILDRDTVLTGSYNFSKSANTKNDENLLILHDADLAARYTEEFESLIAQ